MGLASAYLFFVAQTLSDLLEVGGRSSWVVGLAPVLFALTLVRDLGHFAKFSLASQFANLAAFGSILYICFSRIFSDEFGPNSLAPSADTNPLSGFAVAFSISIYSFEGAGLILSLEHSLGVFRNGGGCGGSQPIS